MYSVNDLRDNKCPKCLFNFRSPRRGVGGGGAFNILFSKLLQERELKNNGISTPSIDTSRLSRDPYCSFKSQHPRQNPTQGYCIAIISPSLIET